MVSHFICFFKASFNVMVKLMHYSVWTIELKPFESCRGRNFTRGRKHHLRADLFNIEQLLVLSVSPVSMSRVIRELDNYCWAELVTSFSLCIREDCCKGWNRKGEELGDESDESYAERHHSRWQSAHFIHLSYTGFISLSNNTHARHCQVITCYFYLGHIRLPKLFQSVATWVCFIFSHESNKNCVPQPGTRVCIHSFWSVWGCSICVSLHASSSPCWSLLGNQRSVIHLILWVIGPDDGINNNYVKWSRLLAEHKEALLLRCDNVIRSKKNWPLTANGHPSCWWKARWEFLSLSIRRAGRLMSDLWRLWDDGRLSASGS